MRANLKTQRHFLGLVKKGVLIVPKRGHVSNSITGKIYDRIGNTGYVAIAAKLNGKKIQIQAHRLMWLVHKGWLKSWQQINHKDGVKYHNRISNFEKTDNAGNSQHAYDRIK